MDNSNNVEFNSFDLITFIWRKKKYFIAIGVLAAIVSSIASLMIEEKYESTVTLYPAKSSSVTFNEVITEDQSVSKFGEEDEAEQMLQILESGVIRNQIIKNYNLINHYKIDTSSKYVLTELNETYAENIKFKRNNNGAVLITVLDINPDTAALIANDIASLFDSTKNAMIHERAQTDFNIKKRKLVKLKNEMQILRDTMSKLSSMGVVTDDAYNALTEAFILSKDAKTKNEFEQKMKMTEKYGSVLKSFQIEIEFLSERLATMETSYEQAESDANSFLSHKFIVEKASPSEKKAYPVRWLIVVMSTLSAIAFLLIIMLFSEKIKRIST